MRKRLRKLLCRLFQIKWPAFGPTVEMETCLDIYTDKVINLVSRATALGGEENLRENVRDELKNVFFTGGQVRIERIHRKVRNLEIEIRSGEI
jgi:hypothetical protein